MERLCYNGKSKKQICLYTYDEFGNSSENVTLGFINEVTYTGSMTDTSTGLQYIPSLRWGRP